MLVEHAASEIGLDAAEVLARQRKELDRGKRRSVEFLRRAERLAELGLGIQPVVEGAVVARDSIEKSRFVDPDSAGQPVERASIGDEGRVLEQLGDPAARDLAAFPVMGIGDLHRPGHGGVEDRPGMARVLRQQGGRRRVGARPRLVVEALPLPVDPDVAGGAAKDEAAPPAPIAVVRGRVDVEPDVPEMGEVAACLADQRMARPGGVGTGTLHDPVFGEIGSDLQDHVEVGVETARRHQDGPAIHRDSVAVLDIPALKPGSAAVFDADAGDFGPGHDLAAARAIGLDQPAGQLSSVSARAGPADDRIALLRQHEGPLDTEPLGPEIEVAARVLDVVPRPYGIDRGPAPFHPVFEGEIGAVLDSPFALQRRIDDQAPAARDDRRPAGLRRHLEGDRPRARLVDLDPGGHSRAAGPDDGHIRFETPHTH